MVGLVSVSRMAVLVLPLCIPSGETGTVAGLVRDQTGKPVAGAVVYAVSGYNGSQQYVEVHSASTGADGSYRVEGIPLSRVLIDEPRKLARTTVVAYKNGYALGFQSVLSEELAATVPPVTIGSSGETLQVRVIGNAGEPVAGAFVRLRSDYSFVLPPLVHRGTETDEAATAALGKLLTPTGTTDAQGNVRFAMLLPGRYRADATRTDPTPRDTGLSEDEIMVQRDYRLMGNSAEAAEGFASCMGIPVQPAQENRCLLRLQPMPGKVRVRFLLPDGQTYAGTSAALDVISASRVDAQGSTSVGGIKEPSAWDFSWGIPGAGLYRLSSRMDGKAPHGPVNEPPMLKGSTVIAFSPYRKRGGMIDLVSQPLTANSLRLSVQEETGPVSPVNTKNPLNAMTGSVYLPDGVTPAVGATVLVWSPLSPRYPMANFVTDTTGRFHAGWYADPTIWDAYACGSTAPLRSDGPTDRVLMAYLPGVHGAVVQPFPANAEEQEHRLVLPRSRSLSGSVTVGGKPLGQETPGVVRILAAHSGMGKLSYLCDLSTDAQGDGTFVLSGLTAGTYRIQAVLDNAYLSETQTVTVADDRPLPASLRLAIPEPGEGIVLPLGATNAGVRAELMDTLPEGPLTAARRAAYYVADGAGKLRIEGLPAGNWRLRLSTGKTILVKLPSLRK